MLDCVRCRFVDYVRYCCRSVVGDCFLLAHPVDNLMFLC